MGIFRKDYASLFGKKAEELAPEKETEVMETEAPKEEVASGVFSTLCESIWRWL